MWKILSKLSIARRVQQIEKTCLQEETKEKTRTRKTQNIRWWKIRKFIN